VLLGIKGTTRDKSEKDKLFCCTPRMGIQASRKGLREVQSLSLYPTAGYLGFASGKCGKDDLLLHLADCSPGFAQEGSAEVDGLRFTP
jgi:hypothetical protein